MISSNQTTHDTTPSAQEAKHQKTPHADPAIVAYRLKDNTSSTKRPTPALETPETSTHSPLVPTVKRNVFESILERQEKRARKTKKPDPEMLTELKKFASRFRLPTPIPRDLVEIISNDPLKQKEIMNKSIRDAEEFAKAKSEAMAAKEKETQAEKEKEMMQESTGNAEKVAAKEKAAEDEKKNQANPQLHHLKMDRKPIPQLQQNKLWSDIVRGAPPRTEAPPRAEAPLRTKELNVVNSGGGLPPVSIYSSCLSCLTRSTKKTQTTAPTSVSSYSNTPRSRENPNPAVGVLEDVQEDDDQLPVETQSQISAPLSMGKAREHDEASLISQASTIYTPEQRDDVIVRFSRAILKGLRPNSNYSAASDNSRQHVLPHLRSALKTFAEAAEADTSGRTQAKARKMLRRLRPEIARKLQDQVLNDDRAAESRRVPIDLLGNGQMDPSEKINRWGVTAPSWAAKDQRQPQPEAKSEPDFSFPTRSESTMDSGDLEAPAHDTAGLYGASIDPAEVLKHFTTQPAFESLIQTTEKLFERYHSQKMDLIRHRTSLCLRRFSGSHDLAINPLCAVFNVDWDLKDFLTNSYDDGIHQPLDQILAVTGLIDKAQLCSVGDYFGWCWPRYRVQLLRALQEALNSSNYQSRNPQRRRRQRSSAGRVTVDSTLRTVTARGTEDFIISVAQQISWLVAVCQEKQDQLTYAYVGFFEASHRDQPGTPVFDVDAKLEIPFTQDSGSCWNTIVGPAVLVTGFPLPERNHDERGLEVSIPVMAALAETPQAVTFGGGFVFKSRCHALVPIEDLGFSIQWHFIDTYPEKLEWAHIDKACPTRLRDPVKGSDFWSRRSFLGWCPQVLELLATSDFDYSSTQYSKAGKPPRWAQLEKLTIGFGQWGTATAEITLAKKDGFRSTRPDDYETLLNDAKSTQVILHDTTHRRAFQTNAEDLILHILLHRRRLDPPTATASPSTDKNKVDDLEFASAGRQATSTRIAMLSNAERVYSIRTPLSSSKRKQIRFKHEVKLLYSTLDGLWAHTYAGDSKPVKFSLDFRQTVAGWEYMDVVKNVKDILPKSVCLRKSCGRWNEYAKDIQAVILFGGDFGDILKPVAPTVCSNFISLPRNECYLAVRVDTLQSLFDRQGSLEDQQKLTDSGLTLQGSQDLFKACAGGMHPEGKQCSSQYVVRIVKRSTLRRSHCPLPLEKHGAVIIGET